MARLLLAQKKMGSAKVERSSSPLVVVVILHFKGSEHLLNCVNSVLNSNYEKFEVVLVDNGSQDGSVESVEKCLSGKIHVIRSSQNLGFVQGYNLALRRVKADYVVLLNDDTTVDPYWLDHLVTAAESNSSIGACQPKLRWSTRPEFFEYNGACGGMLDACGVPFTRGRLFDKTEEDCGQYDTTVDIFWASGAAMFLRYRALVEAGYLDDMFYAHMEEIDLSWRLRLRGYTIVSVPSSIVYHVGGGTSLPTKSFLKHRNNLLTLFKNYSTLSLIRYMPLRLFLDLASLLYFSAKKRHSYGIAMVNAYLWLIRNARKIWKARRFAQSLRIVPDSVILSSMAKPSIVLQYYLLGRLCFSQLCGLPLPLDSYMNTNYLGMSRPVRLAQAGGLF